MPPAIARGFRWQGRLIALHQQITRTHNKNREEKKISGKVSGISWKWPERNPALHLDIRSVFLCLWSGSGNPGVPSRPCLCCQWVCFCGVWAPGTQRQGVVSLVCDDCKFALDNTTFSQDRFHDLAMWVAVVDGEMVWMEGWCGRRDGIDVWFGYGSAGTGILALHSKLHIGWFSGTEIGVRHFGTAYMWAGSILLSWGQAA